MSYTVNVYRLVVFEEALMYKKAFAILTILLLTIALSGCDVLFGGGDDYSKNASSSSGGIELQDPLDNTSISTASYNYKWRYLGNTGDIKEMRISINDHWINISTVNEYYNEKFFAHVFGQDNYWYVEAIGHDDSVIAKSPTYKFWYSNNSPSVGTPSTPWASADKNSMINLGWGMIAGSSGYKVYAQDGPDKRYIWHTENQNVISTTDYRVFPNNAYTYYVSTIDGSGKENLSVGFGGSTTSPEPIIVGIQTNDNLNGNESRFYSVDLPITPNVMIRLESMTVMDGAFELYNNSYNHLHYENQYPDTSDEIFNYVSGNAADTYFIKVINQIGAAGTFTLKVD